MEKVLKSGKFRTFPERDLGEAFGDRIYREIPLETLSRWGHEYIFTSRETVMNVLREKASEPIIFIGSPSDYHLVGLTHQGESEEPAWGEPRTLWVKPDTEQAFRKLAEKWYEDTLYTSSITKMTMHPAYLRIIGMGSEVVPLLLCELEQTGDHWLVALHAITGEDPAPPNANFNEAVEAWLVWGKENGYL